MEVLGAYVLFNRYLPILFINTLFISLFAKTAYACPGAEVVFTALDCGMIETSYPGAPILQLRAILYIAQTSEFTSVLISDDVNSDTEVAGPLPVPKKISDSLLSKKSEDL